VLRVFVKLCHFGEGRVGRFHELMCMGEKRFCLLYDVDQGSVMGTYVFYLH
jgi:hypothetical protein